MSDTMRARLSPLERRAIAVLGTVYALRIFGLFLILPVFALYAADLEGHTPFLVGLALGAYGLMQALLQFPFGSASDRLGRKPVIVVGLLIFALGSAVAALADSIWGVILGRAIQGAGAIPAVAMALLSDVTRETQRTKAMAAIGGSIGAAFIVSMVLSPLLEARIGVDGMFWLMAAAALAAIPLVWLGVPTPTRAAPPTQKLRLADGQLLRLDAGIFVLHFALTALFVVLPLALVQRTGIAAPEHWKIYLGVMLASLVAMVPLVLYAHRRARTRGVFVGAIGVLLVAECGFFLFDTALWPLVASLTLFFTAFNLLEALLPAWVSRIAPPQAKGAAMGVYSTAQFLGAFAGGALGGLVQGLFGLEAVFVLVGAGLLLWLLIALGLREPAHVQTHVLYLNERQTRDRGLTARLAALPGVAEAVRLNEEGVVYLQVDPRRFDRSVLDEFATAPIVEGAAAH